MGRLTFGLADQFELYSIAATSSGYPQAPSRIAIRSPKFKERCFWLFKTIRRWIKIIWSLKNKLDLEKLLNRQPIVSTPSQAQSEASSRRFSRLERWEGSAFFSANFSQFEQQLELKAPKFKKKTLNFKREQIVSRVWVLASCPVFEPGSRSVNWKFEMNRTNLVIKLKIKISAQSKL